VVGGGGGGGPADKTGLPKKENIGSKHLDGRHVATIFCWGGVF